MRLDYPLELINSKLPSRRPSYYQKCLIRLFVGNIGLLVFLYLLLVMVALIIASVVYASIKN